VASETSASRATSGMVTAAPERMSSRQAWTIAMRVRFFWLTRPVSLSVVIGMHPSPPFTPGISWYLSRFMIVDLHYGG
jgi:hypothetical protein